MSKYRNFIFTINNYKDTELVDNIDCRYIAYGKEVAPTTGTPHLQGFLCFWNATTAKSVKKKLPGAWVENMKGSIAENTYYCNKEGMFVERGDKPMSNEDKGRAIQLKYHRAWECAKSGDFDSIDSDIKLRYYSTILRIRKDYMEKPPPVPDVCGIWLWGDSGTGKSHSVVTQHPGRYMKPNNKWWDGYQGEDVVHLDELCPSHVTWITPYLKKWADKWPFDAELKGGATQLRPKLVIITSNYSIDDMGFSFQDLGPIKRRFREIQKLMGVEVVLS